MLLATQTLVTFKTSIGTNTSTMRSPRDSSSVKTTMITDKHT